MSYKNLTNGDIVTDENYHNFPSDLKKIYIPYLREPQSGNISNGNASASISNDDDDDNSGLDMAEEIIGVGLAEMTDSPLPLDDNIGSNNDAGTDFGGGDFGGAGASNDF